MEGHATGVPGGAIHSTRPSFDDPNGYDERQHYELMVRLDVAEARDGRWTPSVESLATSGVNRSIPRDRIGQLQVAINLLLADGEVPPFS
jgi:hypothetical protein